jgi:hypothetical protein
VSEILDLWENAPDSMQLLKAMQDDKQKKNEEAEVRSAIIDPYNYGSMSLGTRARPAIIPYQTLRRMANVPAIAAILLTRQNQASRFTRRPRYDGDMGFAIKLKDKRKKMSDAAQKRAMEIEDFFLKTGGIRNLKRKDNFNTFLRKITRDTLVLDALVWENVSNLKGNLAEIWAVDAASIELVAQSPVSEMFELPVYVPNTKHGHKIAGDIAYIQRINGQVVAEYAEEDLAYAIRNPRTDLEVADFGMSELEMLVEIVTGIMNGVRYNTSYFNHSSLPQGILSLVGKYNDKTLEGFRRHWKQLTSGASGKWATPVMAMEEGQGIDFVNFKNSNRDMEFNEFLEFLFNVACAVYQIDPNEVGFKSWTSSTSMSQSDNTEAKMEGSKDKGFVPLMHFFSDTFNSEIVDRIDEEFEFSWVGVDEEDEDQRNERDNTLVAAGIKTVAQVRKERDMEEILGPDGAPAKWTQAPANAQLIQVFMAESGLGQQPGDGQDPNDPQAEADNQQAQADDAHEKGKEMADDAHEKEQEASDDDHGKELEKMDVEHKQNIEMEKLKHKNTMEQKKQDAKNKPKPAPAKKPLKKSIDTSEDGGVEIVLSWDNY